jgi:Bardet-Biedl syndrome 9 protein
MIRCAHGLVAWCGFALSLLGAQGWEERIDAAMTHLLRTVLAKTAKETTTVSAPLSMPADTSKLKKHITYVCDRLSKGAQLALAPRARKGGKKGAVSAAELMDPSA